MSKIYEALLRAEIERLTNSSGQQPDVGLPEPEALLESGLHVQRPAADLPPASAAVTNGGTASYQALLTPAPAVAPGQDTPEATFARIATHAWKFRQPTLPTLQQRGAIVEQFRTLRSRLYEFRDMGTLNTILISSASPREGKSFTSANLAIALARHKATRVLLIDGDMRRGTLHDILGTRKGPGLTEYLAGKAEVAEVMERGAIPAGSDSLPRGLSSLAFIPSGIDHEQAADLSGSARFAELLQVAHKTFDWVIVDSSPVTLVSDAINLSRACDGVLLVTRAGFTRFETAQKALAELRATRMLGVVLNDADQAVSTGGAYGYGSYYAA